MQGLWRNSPDDILPSFSSCTLRTFITYIMLKSFNLLTATRWFVHSSQHLSAQLSDLFAFTSQVLSRYSITSWDLTCNWYRHCCLIHGFVTYLRHDCSELLRSTYSGVCHWIQVSQDSRRSVQPCPTVQLADLWCQGPALRWQALKIPSLLIYFHLVS